MTKVIFAVFICPFIHKLIDHADLIVEASGDAIYGTQILQVVANAHLPIVTMDSELQVTTGSYFADKGYFSEADGDQPGCLARLEKEVKQMGFHPLAFVNIKGFLNLNPTPSSMKYWAKKQQLRLEQVVSFTDGSKVQIEQALVANGLKATIAKEGLIGGTVQDLKEADYLANNAEEKKQAISDFVVCQKAPPGVFILASNDIASSFENYLAFSKLKTENGKYFILLRPYHLCFLEVVRTIQQALEGQPPLLNNTSQPTVSVSSVAKRSLKKGTFIKRALGSFDVRGETVNIATQPNHVPICLLANVHITRNIEPGQIITFDDVELERSLAHEIYQDIRDGVLSSN